jgi:anti-sigma factor RsiW
VNLSEETLMAYVDGELDDSARKQVEIVIAEDPEVARRVARQQALRGRLRSSFATVLDEPVPQRLVSLVRAAAAAPGQPQVLQFRRKPAAQRSWLQWGSLAASFVLGALVWQFTGRQYLSGPITENHGQLVAAGALAQALTGQLAAQQDASAATQIGISFRSKRGDYCRTFLLRDATSAAGLACRQNNQWTVQVLAQADAPMRSPGQYRQAASSVPPAVLRAVDDSIAGEPLDSVAETQARATGWQAKP